MIRPVVGEGFLFGGVPSGCSTLVCVSQANYVVYVDEVTRLGGVKTYGGCGLVAVIAEIRAIIAICTQVEG